MVKQVFAGQCGDAVAVAGEVRGRQCGDLAVLRADGRRDRPGQQAGRTRVEQRCGGEHERLDRRGGVRQDGRSSSGVAADELSDHGVCFGWCHGSSVAGVAGAALTPG